MIKPIQKRAIATRSRLMDTAKTLISKQGYESLRIEELVKEAGVAKGTFFAHFVDKDGLMSEIIGARLNAILDDMAAMSPPDSVEDLTDKLLPLMHAMSCERYVFDLVIRYSGAAAIEEIGPIAMVFFRHNDIVERWLRDGPFRKDVPDMLLAEGIQGLAVQVMALKFCAIHNEDPLRARFLPFVKAWLTPAPQPL